VQKSMIRHGRSNSRRLGYRGTLVDVSMPKFDVSMGVTSAHVCMTRLGRVDTIASVFACRYPTIGHMLAHVVSRTCLFDLRLP